MKRLNSRMSLAVLLVISVGLCRAQVNVTATAVVGDDAKKSKTRDASNIVIWLTPVEGLAPAVPPQAVQHPRLTQKNKSFEPHVLVIPVGTQVGFPNRDPFFHNVFSLFEGKRFDLGLYEAGSTRDVLFDKPGISYIFCNIHAEMSAVVIALNTPYYAISDRKGQVTIPRVPSGRYTMRVWYETATPEALAAMVREVTVDGGTGVLGILHLPAPGAPLTHTNMYGKDYPPAKAGDPAYPHP
jgi:plastocyanin